MSTTLPPGIPWLAIKILSICTPAAAVYAFIHLLAVLSLWESPRGAMLSCALLALPVKVFVQFWVRELRMHREAEALGARRVSRVRGKWPGNLDVVVEEFAVLASGYITSSRWRDLKTPLNFWIMKENIIITTEPEHIKTMLNSQFENFPKGDKFLGGMASILGTGILNSDRDLWRYHRSMTRPFFSRDRITHFDIFDRHASDVISLVKQRMRTGYALDFQDLAARFTFDAALDFLCGSCFHILSADLPFPHNAPPELLAARRPHLTDACAEDLRELTQILHDRCMVVDFWPLFEVFRDRSWKPMSTVNALVDPILEKAIERKLANDAIASKTEAKISTEVKDDDTLLDYMLRHTTDQTILRDTIINMIGAGRDTTSSLLTFTIYALAMYPSVLLKLRSEILSRVGSLSAPTYEDIKDMKYLKAFINETLRLYPSIAMNFRTCLNGSTFPAPRHDEDRRPFYIPGGSTILYSVWEMHRRKDLWGEDADEFDPERFIDERHQKYLLANPFIFLPFNSGPRICLGQQFAYNEVSFLLVRLLQAFSNITLDTSAQPPGSAPPAEWANGPGRQAYERCFPKSHINLSLEGGLWVKFEEADELS